MFDNCVLLWRLQPPQLMQCIQMTHFQRESAGQFSPAECSSVQIDPTFPPLRSFHNVRPTATLFLQEPGTDQLISVSLAAPERSGDRLECLMESIHHGEESEMDRLALSPRRPTCLIGPGGRCAREAGRRRRGSGAGPGAAPTGRGPGPRDLRSHRRVPREPHMPTDTTSGPIEHLMYFFALTPKTVR